MPAWRLDENEREVTKYDVGATDGAEPFFVGHVFLCNVENSTPITSNTKEIEAIHMSPPLENSNQQIEILGTAQLDDETSRGERRQIKSFVDDRLLERQAQLARLDQMGSRSLPLDEYIIHPSAKGPDSDYPL